MIKFNPDLDQKLSTYFKRSEFACGCGCGYSTVDVQLLVLLDHLREKFGRIRITSAARCPVHNTRIGGASYSCHLRGIAADVVPLESKVEDVFEYLKGILIDKGAAICYKSNGFIHLDVASRLFIEVRK